MSVALSQKQRVIRLYRHALKNCLSWAIHRDIFYSEAERIRKEFEKSARITDRAAIERLILKGQQQVREKEHPDPYIVPYAFGGSLYARNPPFPNELHQQLDFGREDFH